MSKKHIITKRLLAFALSVAMIVTFTPTAMLSYANDNEPAAAVEEQATEPTEVKDDVVKEEAPAKEEVKEVEEEAAKEDVAKEKEEEDVSDATKDTLVRAKVVVDEEEMHVPYDGEEHVIKRSDVEERFHLEYEKVNGDKITPIDALPEGFEVNVVIKPIEKQSNPDEITATNAGKYGFFIRAEISGSAPGFYYDERWQSDVNHRGYVYMVIDSNKLTVTINGVDQEMTYDGSSHLLDMFEISCDADDYSIRDIDFVSKPDSARNAGTYATGTPVMDCISNTNHNYDVTFVLGEPGTLTINPAPLTLYTGSDRVMVDPESDKYLTCERGWVEGLVGRDCDKGEFDGVDVSGRLPINQVGTATNVGKILWGHVLSSNYIVTEKFGTLTVFDTDEVQITIQGDTPDKKSITYDGKLHSVKGWRVDWIDNPIFDKTYYRYLDKEGINLVKLNDGVTAYVEGKDVGEYHMGLTDEDFYVDTETCPDLGDFKVTFVVRDGGFTIDKMPLTVDIMTKYESHPYTGEEYTMKAFTVVDANKLAEAYGYTEDDIEYIGNKEIKGTEIGLYSETLTLDNFKNTNKNFEVKFRLRNEFELVGPIGRKGEKAKEEVIKEENYTSTLEIFRPVVRVKLEGTGFTVPYDGNKHTLKVDAETNKAFFDGVEQEGSAFKVSSVENKYEVPFDENGIYLRSDIELSGTNAGIYRERNWVKRLSYDDPSIAVEFVADNDKAPMEVRINRIPLKLVVDDVTKTYEGEGIRYYDENNMLTAHYEKVKTGEIVTDGPKYRVYFAGLVEKAPPVGAFEQHYLDADILSDSSNYEVVEIEKGIFTFNQREVTVTVKGNKKRVIVERDKSGELCEQYVYGYELISDDPLYDADTWVEFINGTGDKKAPYAHGKTTGKYMMELDDTDKYKFDNRNSCFKVKFEVEDGYIEIINSSNEPVNLGEIVLVAKNCTYDGEFHPAKLDSTDVTVGEKTYSIKLNRIDYWSLDDNTIRVPENGPIDVGSYKASIGYRGCLSIYDGDVEVTDICRWSCNEPEYTISKHPVTVTVVGDKKIVPYDGKYHEVGGYSFNSSYELYDPYKFVESNAKEPAFQKDVGTYEYILNAEWFSDTSANFEATFEVEDGFLQIVGEENKFDIPRVTPINEVVPYDGEGHAIHYNFEELNEDGLFEVVSETDNNTYYVKPRYPRIPRRVEPFVGAGVYTWNRTISTSKVFDKDGADVTALVNNPWEREVYAGTLTITPIEATVNIKDGLCKTYGDPDPIDKSDWVEVIADEPALSEVNNRLEIERVRGENVGKYEIRVSLRPIFVIDPGSPGIVVKDEGGEVAKKSVRSAKAEAKKAVVGYEYEPYIIADTQPNIAIKGDNKDKFFTINKADLVITANNDQKNFGEDDPTLTATVGKGLVGSESLPKNFYTVTREKGEAVRMKPKFYEIVVKAPNVDINWDEETHYFKDELIPVPFDPPVVEREDAERPAEEAYAEDCACEKEAVEEALERVEVYDRVAKTKRVDRVGAGIKEYKEVEDEIYYPPAEEAAAEAPAEAIEWSDNYSAMSSEFNLMNYNVITKNGEFYINGDENGGDDEDDTEGTETASTGGSSDKGGSGSSTGDEFGLLGMLVLLTASLIGMIAVFTRRRREQE